MGVGLAVRPRWSYRTLCLGFEGRWAITNLDILACQCVRTNNLSGIERVGGQGSVKSSFQLNVGLGESSKLNLPAIEIGDTSFVPIAGTLVFANLNAELNVTLNEAVAYYLSVSFSARLGAEPSSLYSNGINTISGIHNAWKIRLFQNKKRTRLMNDAHT